MIWLIKQQFCCYITFFLFVTRLLFHVFIIHTFVGKKSQQKHQESQSSLNFLKYFSVSTPSSARIFMMLFLVVLSLFLVYLQTRLVIFQRYFGHFLMFHLSPNVILKLTNVLIYQIKSCILCLFFVLFCFIAPFNLTFLIVRRCGIHRFRYTNTDRYTCIDVFIYSDLLSIP